MQFNSSEEIIAEISKGRMVILVDDKDRENEGDLVMAAEAVTPEAINFMATHARGLICLTLDEARCDQLGLPMMVPENGCAYGTAFTLSIDAAHNVTTGISAADRAETVRAAVATTARPDDLVQPGHIFPLRARKGGVLTRAGHTEAGCDLASLAGYIPSAVIVEIMNDDGTMARRPDLETFAAKHELKIGSIADLIQYRLATETTITRIGEQSLPTVHGEFNMITFEDKLDDTVHIALVMGEVTEQEALLVRVHVIDPLRDLIGAEYHDPQNWSLWAALEEVASEGRGVVIALGNSDTAASLLQRAPQRVREPQDMLKKTFADVGTGAQILKNLGVRKIRHLGPPWRFTGLESYDLEVVETIPFAQQA